jgi:GTP-binding protein EngB required for normal cell division
VALLALFLVLVATDTALSVWSRLAEAPAWLRFAYLAMLLLVTLAAMALAWRWLRPARRIGTAKGQRSVPADPAALEAEVTRSAEAGVDVAGALAELREQRRRRDSGAVFLAVFGEVSTGKSALVRALLPEASAHSDARAGTTTEIRHYRWQAPSGDEVVIADLPGFNLDEDPAVLDEARRAHLVVFLVDGDLTRSQGEELARLRRLGKPLIVALNKADRFDAEQRALILQRLAERSGVPAADVAAISAGGREEVVRLLSDGSERRETRQRTADVEALRDLIQARLDSDGELMDSLRDTAVLLLAAEKLEAARAEHREGQARELVRTYSRRAIVGALAAVAPGSDLVIQGALATRLLQELCALYDVSVKEVQIESFLKLAGGKVRKMSALTLAISGNALKAFPGLGTLTGGLLHAVAYGMIFDSLGRAAAETLATRGELRPIPAAAAFEEHLSETLETRAGRFAKLALAEKREDRAPSA